jgi:hypothetical protein
MQTEVTIPTTEATEIMTFHPNMIFSTESTTFLAPSLRMLKFVLFRSVVFLISSLSEPVDCRNRKFNTFVFVIVSHTLGRDHLEFRQSGDFTDFVFKHQLESFLGCFRMWIIGVAGILLNQVVLKLYRQFLQPGAEFDDERNVKPQAQYQIIVAFRRFKRGATVDLDHTFEFQVLQQSSILPDGVEKSQERIKVDPAEKHFDWATKLDLTYSLCYLGVLITPSWSWFFWRGAELNIRSNQRVWAQFVSDIVHGKVERILSIQDSGSVVEEFLASS